MRSLICGCLILVSVGTGDATEAGACPAGAKDPSCPEPLDNEVLLQAKTRVDDDEASQMTEDDQDEEEQEEQELIKDDASELSKADAPTCTLRQDAYTSASEPDENSAVRYPGQCNGDCTTYTPTSWEWFTQSKSTASVTNGNWAHKECHEWFKTSSYWLKDEAKQGCLEASGQCKGITRKCAHDGNQVSGSWKLHRGCQGDYTYLDPQAPAPEVCKNRLGKIMPCGVYGKGAEPCQWEKMTGRWAYPGQTDQSLKFTSVSAAKAKCIELGGSVCAAITCEPGVPDDS